MSKILSTRQFAAIKRVYKNVSPLILKRDKIDEKIRNLMDAKEDLNREIEGHEAGIKMLTGGYTSEHLVVRVITTSTDKDGNLIKITKWEPRRECVVYDKDNNNYVFDSSFYETPDAVVPESLENDEESSVTGITEN